tara:strand:+ start:50 stop:283 length:234 start_codon:yes stop_codon:yes gene_type:complete
MPWNPEHYNMKIKAKKKNKLLSLKDHYIPGLTEKSTHSEEMQDKLEPIDDSDEMDYRYGDFRDEIRDVEALKKKTQG